MGVMIADEHIQADVRDFEKIKNLTAGIRIDLVITDQSDIAVETVQKLATHFGLRRNNPNAVKKFTNKFISRQYATEQKIPVPAFCNAFTADEVKSAVTVIGLPVILKPVDSQSSRGIFKIDESNIDQLDQLIPLIFKESAEKYILIEKYFIGEELTVEGICSNGKHKTLALSMKKHFRTGIASDLQYPAEIPAQIENEIIRINDLYVENSGLEFGITHAEYLFNSITNEICLVEIACRGGGSLIASDIASWVSGIDLYEILVNELNGISTDVKSLHTKKRNAILHFFEYQNGIVEEIEGIDDCVKIPGVRMIKLDFKKGDQLKAANDDRSRQGFVVILAESKNQLEEILAAVNQKLKVTISSV